MDYRSPASYRRIDVGTEIQRRLFTVGEYERMVETGILARDDRVELVDGEIVEMSPIGSAHAACVDRLNALLHTHFGDRGIVRVQGPIRLDVYSEPQPDLAILNLRPDFYASAHPTAADIQLVVEVADSSLMFDRQRKLPLYARAGIPEAWIVDLLSERVEIFTRPAAAGYSMSSVASRGQQLHAPALGTAAIVVDEVIGPR
jgi:Uma2 family endonuclease